MMTFKTHQVSVKKKNNKIKQKNKIMKKKNNNIDKGMIKW